ncbi:MAG TPA: alpha/beta hydrolase [Polyangiaceae bacterium]|nr:alpha/beta hydrolase [Polyangiaceae bacterium]
MPHVVHAGVRIHYSVVGEGPPLVLHHGSASNGASWIHHGYVKPLREHYRLILLDARGHGQSDKPRTREAHSLALRVGDVTAVLDALELPRAHFFGYSMGGWIGFGMARHAPSRLESLVIGGAHPFAGPVIQNFLPRESHAAEELDEQTFVSALERVLGEPVSGETRRFLVRNDWRAVLASLEERVALDDVLPRIAVRTLLFSGSDDRRHEGACRAASQIRGAEFVSLPGQGHLGALASAEYLLPRLLAFWRGR